MPALARIIFRLIDVSIHLPNFFSYPKGAACVYLVQSQNDPHHRLQVQHQPLNQSLMLTGWGMGNVAEVGVGLHVGFMSSRRLECTPPTA